MENNEKEVILDSCDKLYNILMQAIQDSVGLSTESSVKAVIKILSKMVVNCNSFEEFKQWVIQTDQNVNKDIEEKK